MAYISFEHNGQKITLDPEFARSAKAAIMSQWSELKANELMAICNALGLPFFKLIAVKDAIIRAWRSG